MGLDDDDNGRPRTCRRVVAEFAHSAGDEHPDVLFGVDRRVVHRVCDRVRQLRITLGNRQTDTVGRGSESMQMPSKEKRSAIVGPQRLVDTLAVEKPMIKDRHDGIGGGRDHPVNVDCRPFHSVIIAWPSI